MCGLCEGFVDHREGGPLALSERLTLRETLSWRTYAERQSLEPSLGDDARGQHFGLASNFFATGSDPDTTSAIGTIFTPSLSGNAAADALLAGTAWSMSTINYAFATAPTDYPFNYGSGEPSNNFGAATVEFQQAIRYILEGSSGRGGRPV